MTVPLGDEVRVTAGVPAGVADCVGVTVRVAVVVGRGLFVPLTDTVCVGILLK